MDENTQNFLEFWDTYTWPESKPVFFRLYYDDAGHPLCYSMEDHSGKYIEITAEQYAESSGRVIVKNGKLVKQYQTTTSKLVLAQHGTPCHPQDVTIIVDSEPNQKWNLKTYDNN
jgi:hypothetical protein